MNIGTLELILIVVILLVLYGERLPEVTRALGRGFREMKRSLNEIKANVSPVETFKKNIQDEITKVVQTAETADSASESPKNTDNQSIQSGATPIPDLPYPDSQNRPG